VVKYKKNLVFSDQFSGVSFQLRITNVELRIDCHAELVEG